MRNLLAVLVVFISVLVASPIFAQSGYVEYQETWKDKDFAPQLNVYAHGPVRGKLGWSAWSLTSKGWAEAYAGPTWAPTDWLELSANAGIETGKHSFRYAASVWAGKGNFAVLSIYENGSDWWQKTKATYDLGGGVKIGFMSQILLVRQLADL